MGNSLQPTELVTGQVRLSFVHVFEKWGDDESGGPKYSVTLLIPKNDGGTLQRLFAAYAEAVKQGVAPKGKWDGKAPAGIENPIYDPSVNPATPIWDGDGLRKNREEFGPEAKGCFVLTASDRTTRPEIVDASNNPIISAFDPTGKPTVYSGCYGRAYIAFFPYNHKGSRGIGCALRAVQKTADGEPLTAQRLSSDEAFGPAAGAARPAYGQPYTPQQGYGAPVPVPQGYGAPAPQQASYAAPQGYGAPAPVQPSYGAPAPVQPSYGAPAPVQPGYGAPAQQGYVNPITGEFTPRG